LQPSAGNVGIGTNNPTEKLAVNGTIKAQDIVLTLDGWSDFVFDPNYKLMSLDELELSIKAEGHLPGIPSAQETSENGVKIGQLQAKLLQKIEELTLYVIQLKRENQSLAGKLDSLKGN
jgi:hypothetical protein